jgi:hypothetical protein
VPNAVLRLPIILTLALTLAACGDEAKPDPKTERDPAVAAALDDPIMADPDLAAQNRGNTALSGGGPAMAEIPPDLRTPEEADRARTAAQELLGGRIEPAPAAGQAVPDSKLARAATMQGIAQTLALGGTGCPAKLTYGFIWAARLPAGLPVYPRGHARVAAGVDEAACKVRVVRFASPASVADLTDFYYASAAKAGLAPQRRKEGGDEVVAGTKGAASYAVYIRTGADGMSEVDLAVSGF